MLVWGADKLANPAHGMRVAEHFYFGLLGSRALMPALGLAQLMLGLLVLGGVARRASYAALALVTGTTLVGVWRSVVDPWGWWLEGTNALFFPSLIVFAGVLVLLAFADEDVLVLRTTARRPGRSAVPAPGRVSTSP